MPLRTGVDMIKISRVKRAAERHGERFYQRFFTERELVYCGDRYTSLAVRIAAKEATAKALGTGIGDVRWLDIEIITDDKGMPELYLHDAAAELARTLGLGEWSISLSHTDDDAIAFVVAVG